MDDFRKIQIDNIQKIQFDKFEKDFSFIVNNKIYQTNSFVANILSPHISNRSYYQIQTHLNGDFNKILEYGEMKTISIKEEEIRYFREIFMKLGNYDEVLQFYKELQEEISCENVIQRIQIKQELNDNFEDEIEFISSNFHHLYTQYPNEISSFDIDIIERIISNDKLLLQDEEELFDIILNLYNESKEYSTLFSKVIFMNLSSKSIRKFNDSFDINDINESIWKTICKRLEQDISKESIETYQNSHQEFLKNRYIHKKYEHIIQSLSEQYHGNIHTQNIISITSSSTGYGNIFDIVDQSTNNYFGTANKENSWIQLDFKERKVLLQSYTLKTPSGGKNAAHIKSWILEVSNDNNNYTEVDKHENCDLFNDSLKTETFQVSCSTPQRFIRLRQIGPNWRGDNYLYINQIELSGFLDE